MNKNSAIIIMDYMGKKEDILKFVVDVHAKKAPLLKDF